MHGDCDQRIMNIEPLKQFMFAIRFFNSIIQHRFGHWFCKVYPPSIGSVGKVIRAFLYTTRDRQNPSCD